MHLDVRLLVEERELWQVVSLHGNIISVAYHVDRVAVLMMQRLGGGVVDELRKKISDFARLWEGRDAKILALA